MNTSRVNADLDMSLGFAAREAGIALPSATPMYWDARGVSYLRFQLKTVYVRVFRADNFRVSFRGNGRPPRSGIAVASRAYRNGNLCSFRFFQRETAAVKHIHKLLTKGGAA